MSKFCIGTLYDSKPGTSNNFYTTKMLNIQMPLQGMTAGSEGFSETLEFEYGGRDVISSPQSARRYEFSWTSSSVEGQKGIDQIKRLSGGEFGTGLIYFADPFNYTTNLLPPAWASPSLIRSGWRSIYDTVPSSYSTVAASNTTNQPQLSAVFNIGNPVNALPSDKRSICVLPIPEGHTLHLGFSGSATGTAVVRVRPINHDGSYASVTDLTLLSWSGSTRMNTTFAGSSYKAVEIYFTRTGSAGSTLTITSGMAQLLKTGATQAVSEFTAGQGNTGCKFESPAIEESYDFVNMGRSTRLKGISVTLVEAGTSSRYA